MSKKAVSTLFVSLLIISMFGFIPLTGAQVSDYELIFEAATEEAITQYEDSMKLSPEEQELQDMTVGVYVTDYCIPIDEIIYYPKLHTKEHVPLNYSDWHDVWVPLSAYKYTYKYSPEKVLRAFEPPIIDPINTTWHEEYPQYSHEWAIVGWEDTDDSGDLSYCDQILMTQIGDPIGAMLWFHVDKVFSEDPTTGEIGVFMKVRQKQYYNVCFEHWEVWDQDGTPELEWEQGIQYRQVYTGEWEQQGVTYTRITKLVVDPKGYRGAMRPQIAGNLEMKYQRSAKWLETQRESPYLRWSIHNPEGGGDKKIIAVYHIQWGPKTPHMYFKTILGAEAETLAFKAGETDLLSDLILYTQVTELAQYGTVTSAPGYHLCYVASNMRNDWMGPQDGQEPGKSLRKAIAQLLDKDTLIGLLFKFLVKRLDTMLPTALTPWYHYNETYRYDYDPREAYNTLMAGGWRFDGGMPGTKTWYHDANGNEQYDAGEPIAGGADHDIEIMSPLPTVAITSFTIVDTLAREMNALTDPAGNPTPLVATNAPTDFWTIVIQAFQLHDFEMYFLCWGDIFFPTLLYFAAHSKWKHVEWSDNSPGFANATLDEKLDTVYYSLDHDEKLDACHRAQEIMMDILGYIPVYSRNYFNVHQHDYYGVVVSPGFGVSNDFTYLNIKGQRVSTLFTPPLTQIVGNETIRDIGEHVESYNPAEAGSAYAFEVLDRIHDGLLQLNPYTNEYKPWLAKTWTTVEFSGLTPPTAVKGNQLVVDGMYAEYELADAVVEGKVVWHDGEVFDADDIIWGWNFIWTEGLSNHLSFWVDLVDLERVDKRTVRCYWNVTSQWLQYSAAGLAGVYAPQIFGQLVGAGDAGVRAFRPEDHLRSELGPYPACSAFPWLTQVVGLGYYVLYDANDPGTETNLFTFDLKSHTHVTLGLAAEVPVDPANPECTQWIGPVWEYKLWQWEDTNPDAELGPSDQIELLQKDATGTPVWPQLHYHVISVVKDGAGDIISMVVEPKKVPWLHWHKTVSDIWEQKVEDFYHIGDVTLDSSINIVDLASIAIKYGKRGPTHPEAPSYKGFIAEDVIEDGVINLKDLATAGWNYGKEKEY